MSSWCGTARSNHIKVVDMADLLEALAPFDIEVLPGDEGKHYLTPGSSSDSGGWPAFSLSGDAEVEFDPAVHICPFMADGEILVMMEAGAERLRYITGEAQAYSKWGQCVTVSLSDVYAKAAEKFNVDIGAISRAAY